MKRNNSLNIMDNNVINSNNENNNVELCMTSLELTELINKFRQEEGKGAKDHSDYLKVIRKEVETLEKLGISNEGNFSLVKKGYKDKKGEWRPCYKLSKFGIMTLLNRESSLVRYKTQQYITELENRNRELSNGASSLDNRIMSKFVEALDIMKTEIKEEIKKEIENLNSKIDSMEQENKKVMARQVERERIVDECKYEEFKKFVEMQNDNMTFDRKVFISFFNSYNFYYKKLGIKEFNQILKDNGILNTEDSQEMTDFAKAEGILSIEEYQTKGECRMRKRIEITKRGMEYITEILCRK